MSDKGKVVSMPTKQRGVVTLIERTATLTVKRLYETWGWLDITTKHNPTVSQTTHKWFTKNKASLKRILDAHDKTVRAQMLDEVKSYFPDTNNGEEIYVQDGHPEIKTDPNGKVTTLTVEFEGKTIPEKGRFILEPNGNSKFISVYTGNPLPKQGYIFKPELKDESLRNEFGTKITELNDKFTNTEYEIKFYELGEKEAQGLNFPTVYNDHSLIDPLFVEDVIYQYLIQE